MNPGQIEETRTDRESEQIEETEQEMNDEDMQA